MTDRHEVNGWFHDLAAADTPTRRAAVAARLLVALSDLPASAAAEVSSRLDDRDVEAGVRFALDAFERRLAAVEAEADDPFFTDAVDSHEALVALLEARDRVDLALRGARRTGRSLSRVDPERSDARLRTVVDRTLLANALRRAATPERASWWWTYRAACDEELVAREASGRSTEEDRERLAEHLASCDECRRDLAGITRADRILDGGAGALEVACPSVDELRRFVRGELTPALGRALDVHVTLCDRCRSALRARSD